MAFAGNFVRGRLIYSMMADPGTGEDSINFYAHTLNRSVVQQELNRAGAYNPIGGMGVMMFGPTLLEYGTEAQKQEHIPPIVKGDIHRSLLVKSKLLAPDYWARSFGRRGDDRRAARQGRPEL